MQPAPWHESHALTSQLVSTTLCCVPKRPRQTSRDCVLRPSASEFPQSAFRHQWYAPRSALSTGRGYRWRASWGSRPALTSPR